MIRLGDGDLEEGELLVVAAVIGGGEEEEEEDGAIDRLPEKYNRFVFV
jgi:hypothetical protein|tara:strand:- start:202 stop:345 length:144 start_codon:yes stop_codon:yes gene_type:complete